MQTIDDGPVIEKTKELCQAILDQPQMRAIRRRIDTFLADEKTRSQYDSLVTKGQALQEKQQQSQSLSSEEINDFETHRDALLANPVAREFLDAQEELHRFQHSITRFVGKTLELGRLPTEDELDGGGCGHGCGCH